jgi:hypothetical protein
MKKNNLAKLITIIICINICCMFTFSGLMQVNAVVQTDPITVEKSYDIKSTGAYSFDSPFSSWVKDGTRYFLHSDNWGDSHQKFTGTVDNPIQKNSKGFPKTKSRFFTNLTAKNGKPWIINIYKDSNGGLLAFLHMEFVTHGGTSNKGRIALAYSTNNGDTFRYLGEIVAPYGYPDNDPELSGGFMQGCPYVIKDGYFYIYFTEYGPGGQICTARAPVKDVITAARKNTVTKWNKYYNGKWNEVGMGGNRSFLKGASGKDITGITHTQAVYSTYTKKYYLVTTWMTWNNADTYIKIWESKDCVTWDLYKTVINESASVYGADNGWQYASIIDFGKNENATVGQKFYLYCVNRPYDVYFMKLKRWIIDFKNVPKNNMTPTPKPTSTPIPSSIIGLKNAPMYMYNLDGNANDSVNGVHKGLLMGGANYTEGKLGKGIKLDGVDDYIDIPNKDDLSGMPQLSISCLVKLTQMPTKAYVIVGKDSSDYQYRINVNSAGTATFVVNTTNNFWYTDGTIANSSINLEKDRWYHLVGTYNGNYVKLYVDGLLSGSGSQPISGSITTGKSPLRIGFKSGSLVEYTNGVVDEVEIYNTALSIEDVENLKNKN